LEITFKCRRTVSTALLLIAVLRTITDHCIDSLDMNQTASLAYDTETYDDFPNYDWNENFDIDGFARTIENYNENIWTSVKDAICGKLGINSRRSGCKPSFAPFLPLDTVANAVLCVPGFTALVPDHYIRGG